MEQGTDSHQNTAPGTSAQGLPDLYFSEISKLLDRLDARPPRSHSVRGLENRGELGDFTSISCFRAAIAGLNDILGEQAAGAVLIRAGQLRGMALVDDWGLGERVVPLDKLAHLLDAALGQGGTRLCVIVSVERQGENIVVNASETIGSVADDGGPRRCTFTLGAVWGALEALTHGRYTGQQTQSVVGGGEYDQFTFRPIS